MSRIWCRWHHDDNAPGGRSHRIVLTVHPGRGTRGGGTVLRFAQSGFLAEGWEIEYSSYDVGWDLFFANLRSYLEPS